MKKAVYRITGDAMLLAIYIVLSTLTIKLTPNLQITFSGLAIIMAIVLYGYSDGIIIAFLGSFVSQLRSAYGLTVTTPIWMIPPILRAVVFGLFYQIYLSRGIKLQDKKIMFFVAVMVAGLATTLANTGAIYLDALIFEYPVSLALIESIFRFVSSIASSVAIGAVTLPIIYALTNAGLLRDRVKSKYIKTVLCYLFKGDECLLLYRNKKENDINEGKWIGVGGHVEKDESIESALIREVKEETNLDLKDYKKNGIVYFEYGKVKEEMHLFTSSNYSGEIKECNEGTLKYVKVSEMNNLPMWEGDHIFLKYLLTNEPYFELKLIYKDNKLLSDERIK